MGQSQVQGNESSGGAVAKSCHVRQLGWVSSKSEMVTIRIALSRTQTQVIEQQVALRGFCSNGDYIRELVLRAQRMHEREDLDRRLMDGLSSGTAKELTAQDWEALREGLQHRNQSQGEVDGRPT